MVVFIPFNSPLLNCSIKDCGRKKRMEGQELLATDPSDILALLLPLTLMYSPALHPDPPGVLG